MSSYKTLPSMRRVGPIAETPRARASSEIAPPALPSVEKRRLQHVAADTARRKRGDRPLHEMRPATPVEEDITPTLTEDEARAAEEIPPLKPGGIVRGPMRAVITPADGPIRPVHLVVSDVPAPDDTAQAPAVSTPLDVTREREILVSGHIDAEKPCGSVWSLEATLPDLRIRVDQIPSWGGVERVLAEILRRP